MTTPESINHIDGGEHVHHYSGGQIEIVNNDGGRVFVKDGNGLTIIFKAETIQTINIYHGPGPEGGRDDG